MNETNLCTKCGKPHGMVVENKETGEYTPCEFCYDCLFFGTPVTIKERVVYTEEVGSALKKS